ncbi:response regulator [Paractinoplanes durhamensis]|uniref:response regulator n=1 Tax=Paractinoplanes durhamensis TaxID=113563 RepID=UPI00362DD67F
MTTIRVLVVEDEPLIAEAHAAYTLRVEGFAVAGVAHTAQQAMATLRTTPVDLLLLDLNLPDMNGLDMCRSLRAAGMATDVLVVTSARDLAVVRAAVSLGVTHYLLKPFTFATFREKLLGYARYRTALLSTEPAAAQHEIDRAFAALRGSSPDTLPKGLDQKTLDLVLTALRAAPARPACRPPR